MVNQLESDVFLYHHNQKLQREAEASRLLKGVEKKTPDSDIHSRSKIAWLLKQLAGQKGRRQEENRETAKSEQGLNSG